jgi:tetrahydromethanopterin S-methyltransferase subunit G
MKKKYITPEQFKELRERIEKLGRKLTITNKTKWEEDYSVQK